MTWSAWHAKSQELAISAHAQLKLGNTEEAFALFAEAGEAENQALKALDHSKQRTLGITAVSAVSLWFKGRQLRAAENCAVEWLASGMLPKFASEQLKALLQAIWTSQAMRDANVSFLPGQVLIAVKGGQTIPGGAPLDLILEKVQTVQALFFRTIEHLKDLPHRKRGGPPHEIQEACKPWLLQAPPGSYQFSVAIQQPAQADFFKDESPHPTLVAQHFLSILQASSESPNEHLKELVPSDEYRSTFLKLTRNLAPTGKRYSEIVIRSSDDLQRVSLGIESRRTINHVLRPPPTKPQGESEEHVELHGILRALDLNKDWLELLMDTETLRVNGLSEAVDDLIGPMVNRTVTVRAIRRSGKTIRYEFLDIEGDD
jgi:hypothetical protein